MLQVNDVKPFAERSWKNELQEQDVGILSLHGNACGRHYCLLGLRREISPTASNRRRKSILKILAELGTRTFKILVAMASNPTETGTKI